MGEPGLFPVLLLLDIPATGTSYRQLQVHQDATRRAFLSAGGARIIIPVPPKGFGLTWTNFVEGENPAARARRRQPFREHSLLYVRATTGATDPVHRRPPARTNSTTMPGHPAVNTVCGGKVNPSRREPLSLRIAPGRDERRFLGRLRGRHGRADHDRRPGSWRLIVRDAEPDRGNRRSSWGMRTTAPQPAFRSCSRVSKSLADRRVE